MDQDHAQQIALWRFRLIAPLLDPELNRRQRAAKRRRIAMRLHEHPFKDPRRVKAETLRWWFRLYQRGGVEGLLPRERKDRGALRAFSAEVLAHAKRLKLEVPQRTIRGLIHIIESQGRVTPGQVRPSTLHRHLAKAGLTGRTTRATTVHRRFEAKHPGDLWQGDEAFFRVPNPEGGTTVDRLFVFIDDHSRIVPHAQFYPHGTLLNLEHAFKKAIQKHGAPATLHVDRGKVYLADQLTKACAYLGIRLLHAAPYEPESKGKIERFIGHLRSAFYPELRDAAYPTRERRNAALWAWIDEVYHRQEHSELGQTPLERLAAGAAHIRRPSDDELHQAFLFRERRTVDKTCILKLAGRRYEMHPVLARQKVEVRFDPEDPDHRIAVYLDGNFLLNACPTAPPPHRPRRIQGPTPPPSSRAGRQYLDHLCQQRDARLKPKPACAPQLRPDDDRLALADLVDFLKRHHVSIGSVQERLAADFLHQHGPLDKRRALAQLKKAIQRKGPAQHIRYYLQALHGTALEPGANS